MRELVAYDTVARRDCTVVLSSWSRLVLSATPFFALPLHCHYHQ